MVWKITNIPSSSNVKLVRYKCGQWLRTQSRKKREKRKGWLNLSVIWWNDKYTIRKMYCNLLQLCMQLYLQSIFFEERETGFTSFCGNLPYFRNHMTATDIQRVLERLITSKRRICNCIWFFFLRGISLTVWQWWFSGLDMICLWEYRTANICMCIVRLIWLKFVLNWSR